jgi:choline dehydrogenase-like flavoprotein
MLQGRGKGQTMQVQEFDVAVIGAGASGIVIASRLAERGVNVVVLEDGADWRENGLDERLRRPFQSFAWTVDSVPADYLWSGMTARRYPGDEKDLYIRGRGLGGSTLINGMIALRPPLSEFADWRAAGGKSWTRAAVLDAFRRIESDRDFGSSPLHGADGPLPVSHVAQDSWGTVDELFTEAATAQGHSWIGDVNGEGEDGMGFLPSAILDGERLSVAHAYLGRPGVPVPTMLDQCTAQSLEIVGGRVTGIRVVRRGEQSVVRAHRVVLAAGAIMTSALLQRSGIGPAGALAEAGVEQILDLPVGENLQEHLGFKFAMHMDESARTAANDTRGNVIVRYSSGVSGFGEGDLVMTATNVSGREPWPPAEMCVVLGQAHSRGSAAITSADPRVLPDVNLGLLVDERDRALARRAFADAYEITHSKPFAGRVRGMSSMSGAALPDPKDGDAVDSWLLAHGAGTAHVCATAPLGRAGDGFSVVDDQTRVHGIENLWIGDLSITPTVPRANTQLTAMMIGERVADVLTMPAEASSQL